MKFSFNDEWATYLAHLWILANTEAKDKINDEFDGSLQDLDKLQKIFDNYATEIMDEKFWQAMGFIFGKVFVNYHSGYDWWVVEDEYGKDVCIRYLETTLIMFPLDFLLKRIEKKEVLDMKDSYQFLESSLAELQISYYS